MMRTTSQQLQQQKQRRPPWILCLLVVLVSSSSCLFSTVSAAKTVLMMDGGGSSTLQVQSIPSSISASDGIVTVVSSPGTPSFLVKEDDDDDSNAVLCLVGGSEDDTSPSNNRYLQCRGPTLKGSSDTERVSLATCSLAAGSILLDGITVGDIESGLQYSRHARTLTGIFQARVVDLTTTSEDDTAAATAGDGDEGSSTGTKKQTLMLGILGSLESIDVDATKKVVTSLYDAAAVERKGAPSFDDVYDLEIVPVASFEESQNVSSD